MRRNFFFHRFRKICSITASTSHEVLYVNLRHTYVAHVLSATYLYSLSKRAREDMGNENLPIFL